MANPKRDKTLRQKVDYDKPSSIKIELRGDKNEYRETEKVLTSIMRSLSMKRTARVKTDNGVTLAFSHHNYRKSIYEI